MRLYLRGKIWWAIVSNPDGGRGLRVSTNCRDRDAAELVAVDAERAAVITRMFRRDANGHLRKMVLHMIGHVRGGTIYFVQASPSMHIKIGYTRDLKARLAVLRNGNAEALTLLHSMRGSRDDERALHRKHKSHRIRGEWYAPEAVLATLAGFRRGTAEDQK